MLKSGRWLSTHIKVALMRNLIKTRARDNGMMAMRGRATKLPRTSKGGMDRRLPPAKFELETAPF